MPYAPTGRWWHFTAYEIRGGYIRPAPGATLKEYDPRARYVPGTDQDAPYERLFDLFDRLHVSFEGGISEGDNILMPISDENYARLTGWCTRYGLLGLGLARVAALAFQPRWQQSAVTSTRATPRLVPVQQLWVRHGARWLTHAPELVATAPPEIRDGDLALPNLWPTSWTAPGAIADAVTCRTLGTSSTLHRALRPEPLATTWAPYFPSAAGQEETFAYPPLLTEAFWRAYAEPVVEFLGAVQILKRAFEALAPRPDPRAQVRDEMVKYRGALLLNDFLHGVTPVLRREGNAFRSGLEAPSLLASFAAMILEDVAHEGDVRRCARPTCARTFVSAATRRYCRASCRRAHEQAVFRERQGRAISAALRPVVPRSHVALLTRAIRRKLGSLRQVLTPTGAANLTPCLRTSCPPGVSAKDVRQALVRAARDRGGVRRLARSGVPRRAPAAAKKLLRGPQAPPNAPQRTQHKP